MRNIVGSHTSKYSGDQLVESERDCDMSVNSGSDSRWESAPLDERIRRLVSDHRFLLFSTKFEIAMHVNKIRQEPAQDDTDACRQNGTGGAQATD